MQTHHKQRCTGRLLLMSLEASSSNSNWQKHNSQFLILSCITQQELELRISFPSVSCRWSSDLWHGLAHILPSSKPGGLLKNLAGHLKICKAIPGLVQFERGSTEFLLTATSPANFLKVGWDHWPPFYLSWEFQNGRDRKRSVFLEVAMGRRVVACMSLFSWKLRQPSQTNSLATLWVVLFRCRQFKTREIDPRM
jgi:hypothetical protein